MPTFDLASYGYKGEKTAFRRCVHGFSCAVSTNSTYSSRLLQERRELTIGFAACS